MEGEIIVRAPQDIPCDQKRWDAKYRVIDDAQNPFIVNPQLIRIESRSSIDVVVSRIAENTFLGIQNNYYISCPNFGIAIPPISDLKETFWITEKLIRAGMPNPDAVTVAQILRATCFYDGPDIPEELRDENDEE